MIKIKIKNATGEDEIDLIRKIIQCLDCKETEIISTRANKNKTFNKDNYTSWVWTEMHQKTPMERKEEAEFKCPDNDAICNIGYACDACPYNTELKK